MKSPPWARRLIPTALGAAMLGIIVVAALTPNIGIGAAQVNSQYTSTNPVDNTLEYALIGVLVAAVAAALLGFLFLQRRKRRGSGGAGAVAAWEQPQGPSSPGESPDTSGNVDYGSSPPGGATSYGAAGAVGGAATYDEASAPVDAGPEWAEAAAPATIASPTVMDEAEPDIDRLMKELDQISDDILKKSPPKKGVPQGPSGDDAPADA